MDRAGLRYVVVLSLGILLAGCGQQGEANPPTNAALDGLTADRLAIAATAAGSGMVVVDGGAPAEGPDRQGPPRPVIWWVPTDGGSPQRHPLPVEHALFDVTTWWTGEDVVVVGLPCPSWSVASDPPDLVDDSAPFIADLCDVDRYLVGLWNPDREEWRELSDVELRATDGVYLEDVDQSRALLRSINIIEGSPVDRKAVLRVIDVESGALEELPSPPESGPDPDASFTPCLDDEGVIGLLVWEASEPPALGALGVGGDEAPSTAAEPLPGRSQHLLSLVVSEGSWVPVTTSGSSSGAAVSPVCSNGGVLVSSQAEAAVVDVEVAEARSHWTSLGDLPRGGAATTVEAQEGRGAPLAIALQDPPRAGPPDAPQMSPLWVLEGSEWERQDDVPYVAGWRGVVAGNSVISLLPEAGTTAQGSIRVVQS